MARKRQCGHRGSEVWTLEEEEDHLLHMDPSLMTERQQMAFLLRTTAQEGMEVVHSSDESLDNQALTSPCHVKKPKWIHREPHVATATLIQQGCGRPLKNKKRPNAADMKPRTTRQKKNKIRYAKKMEGKPPSPSGLDSVSQLDAARSFTHQAPQCALCCDYDTAHEASFSNVLFLCPTCDQKYPTQQALGRRACMI